jgi:c-di-GMP phosphodiesterase
MTDCESSDIEYSFNAHTAHESLPQMIHELRTPLTSIRGSLGLLQTGAFGQLTEQGQRMLQIALQNTERLMRLTTAIGQEPSVPTNIMSTQAMARLRLETDLRSALSRQEFQVHYQPVRKLETNQLLGFEALVRWQHPSLGLVSPVQFIPLAEETELILPIGAWVLQESCRQLKEWQQQFPIARTLTMSVNLSSKQLLNPKLVDQIDQVLDATELDPHFLKLEITESGMMAQAETAAEALFQLQQRGIQIYIDDFGTGYSSLSRLHELPINVLKIDRSFVNEMCNESAKLQIVHSIIALASSLKMEIIAEGIETNQQVHLLKEMGCNVGQGELFSMPMNRYQATALISNTELA